MTVHDLNALAVACLRCIVEELFVTDFFPLGLVFDALRHRVMLAWGRPAVSAIYIYIYIYTHIIVNNQVDTNTNINATPDYNTARVAPAANAAEYTYI